MGLFSFGADKTKCKECGTEFPDSEKLNKHREKAHKKNKEKCRICGTEFNYPYENIKKSASNQIKKKNGARRAGGTTRLFFFKILYSFSYTLRFFVKVSFVIL